MTNILLGYIPNKDGCNLLGFYDQSIHTNIPDFVIEVSQSQHRDIMNEGKQCWRVQGGELVKVASPRKSFKTTPRSQLGLVEYKDVQFNATPNAVSILGMHLGLCALDAQHTAKFWVIKDNEWTQKEFDLEQLKGLALAIESQRVSAWEGLV